MSDITEFANWPQFELTDMQKQIKERLGLALGIPQSALVKVAGKATSEIIESDESWEASAALNKPQTLTQVVDDVLEAKDFDETAKQFAKYYDGIQINTQPMHGYLACTGEGCKVCNSIDIIKNRKQHPLQLQNIARHPSKHRMMLSEYAKQVGHELSAEEEKEFFKVLDIVNSKAKEETFMPDGGFHYGGRYVAPPTKSQIGQALANQRRAMKLANRLKRKEKAQHNKCKGY